ncbi:MAG: response regulator transcription factor [Saprospiraceae bacterium]|nr:response regulator transcription factor [Saprospiraceae bacterium]
MNIAIIEDLHDVAEMLRELFSEQDDMQCTQVYFNAEDAMNFLPNHPVDVVIVDIGLPRKSGIDAIKHILEYCPATQFCMFTVYEDDEKIFKSLQAGAKGYVLKGSAPDKIMEAVRELHAGGSPMSPTIARRIIDLFSKMNLEPNAQSLPITAREKELMELLAKGLLYKEIADRLGITIGTVKQHIHKIYDKLQVSNRTEAIMRLNQNPST